MTTRSNEQIFDRLGALGATMKGFEDNLKAMREDVKSLATKADEREARTQASRAKLYASVEEVKERLHTVEVVAKSAKKTAENSKEVTDRIQQYEQRGKGIMIALGLGGTAVGAGAYGFLDNLLSWIKLKLGF